MTDYGPNHAEVAAYLETLTKLTASQWGKRTLWWSAEEIFLRTATLEYAKFLAVNLGRMEAWHDAALVAVAATEAAYAEYSMDKDPEFLKEISAEPASTAAAAAQALVMRDAISREQFDILFDPMPLAGIDPDELFPNPYGPNTDVVRAFLRILPSLTAEQVSQEGVLLAGESWPEDRREAWRAARTAAWQAAQDAGLGDAYVAAPRDARWVVPSCVQALVVRGLITVHQFELLFAPMRAAGIDPDELLSAGNSDL